MRLLLQREPSTATSTPGRLFLGQPDGTRRFVCYTLEDLVRDGPKVPGATAIPVGTYVLTINHSQRFNKPLPLLMSVPGFAGVRLHGGNTHADTEGCLLLGLQRLSADRIANCAPAVSAVMALIRQAQAQGQVPKIKIVSAQRGEEAA